MTQTKKKALKGLFYFEVPLGRISSSWERGMGAQSRPAQSRPEGAAGLVGSAGLVRSAPIDCPTT